MRRAPSGIRHGYEIDPNQELIALGAANAGAGLFGGFSVDASFSQSAAGEASGNRTQVSSLITAALVLATAVVLAPLFAQLPLAVLSAIVITSVVGLVDIAEMRRYLAWKRTDFLLAMTALGGVVFTTALIGMGIAVALSLLAILYHASRPYIAVLGRIPGDPAIYADAERHPNAVAGPRHAHPPAECRADIRQRRCGEGPDRRAAPRTTRQTSGRRHRYRRHGGPRRRDDRHARRRCSPTSSATASTSALPRSAGPSATDCGGRA